MSRDVAALAGRLEHFLRVLESARRCSYQSISVWSEDVEVVAESVAALRASSLLDGSGEKIVQSRSADGQQGNEQQPHALSQNADPINPASLQGGEE